MIEIKAGQSAESLLSNIALHRQNAEGGRHPINWSSGQASYLAIIEAVESTIEHGFEGDSWEEELHSSMFWQVREMSDATIRPLPLLASAFGSLARWLGDLERELQRIARHDEYAGSSASRLVLDSSALVRGKCFSEVIWTDILGAEEVKIFLPILVIRELDNLKNGGREPKARQRLKKIREILGTSGIGPARVRDGVTLQLLMDPPQHVRLPVNDQEITRRAKYLAGRSGGPLTLMTGDYTQEFIARAEGLQAMTLADELLRDSLRVDLTGLSDVDS